MSFSRVTAPSCLSISRISFVSRRPMASIALAHPQTKHTGNSSPFDLCIVIIRTAFSSPSPSSKVKPSSVLHSSSIERRSCDSPLKPPASRCRAYSYSRMRSRRITSWEKPSAGFPQLSRGVSEKSCQIRRSEGVDGARLRSASSRERNDDTLASSVFSA